MKKNIKKHFKVYLKEKYYSILMELDNIEKITNYFLEKENDSAVLKTISQNTSEIRKRLKLNYKKLDGNASTKIDFLICYDSQKEFFESLLHRMGKIHQKLVQYIFENQINTLPFPLLMKRYSSRILSEFIDVHTTNLGKAVSEKNSFSTLSSWSYKEGFMMIPSDQGFSSFGNHSFYYHDLIWTLPSIVDHEIILASIKENNSFVAFIKKKSKIMTENFREICDGYRAVNSIYLEFFNQNSVEDFLEELYAGYIGYLIHGKSYIVSFLTEKLSEDFGRQFIKTNGETAKTLQFKPILKRDFLLIRQLISVYFMESTADCLVATEDNNLQEFIDEVRDLLEDIIGWNVKTKCLDAVLDAIDDLKEAMYGKVPDENERENSFSKLKKVMEEYDKGIVSDYFSEAFKIAMGKSEEVFDAVKNDYESYIEYQDMMTNFVLVVINNAGFMDNVFKKIQIPLKDFLKDDAFFETKFDGREIVSVHSKIWQKRFEALEEDKVLHRSLLREEVLSSSLDSNNMFTPYVMELKRYLRPKLHLDGTQSLVFGHYDEIKFISKEKEKSIDDFSEEIEDLLDKKKKENEKCFVKKHALLEYCSYGSNDSEEASMEAIFLLYQDASSNIGDSINVLNEIKCTLDSFSVSKYEIFKSLGPEDIVCRVSIRGQALVWKISNELKKIGGIKDTFMILELLPPYKIDKGVWMKQLVRLQKPLAYYEFKTQVIDAYNKNPAYVQDKKLQIFEIEGIYDYELWWYIEDFEPVAKTYNRLIDDGIIKESNSFFVYEPLDES